VGARQRDHRLALWARADPFTASDVPLVLCLHRASAEDKDGVVAAERGVAFQVERGRRAPGKAPAQLVQG